MNGFRRLRNVAWLVCATVSVLAQQAQTPPAKQESLEDAVAQGERERERRPSPTVSAANSDIITVERNGRIIAQWSPQRATRELRFRRDSGARALIASIGGVQLDMTRSSLAAKDTGAMRGASLELAAGMDESDGMPAAMTFGPRSSLINIDYLRLVGIRNPALINVRNVIDPQTRRCEALGGWGDDSLSFSYRFLFISDTLKDCRAALENRHGDLIVADNVPEKLREDLFELYDPVSARLSSKLGSEPALVYVAWQPESPRTDVHLEPGWNRSALLLFSGAGWQEGLDPARQNELRNALTREQVQRRIRETDWPGIFTASAAGYLELLARAAPERNTDRRLAADLPVWISRCASRLDRRPVMNGSQPDVPVSDCGRLLQFIYDAVARAESKGSKTVFDTWRQLLKGSRNSGKAGVLPSQFMNSSTEARRIAQGLTQGSMDWQKFAAELGKHGVRLNIAQSGPGITAQVQSLEYFRDP